MITQERVRELFDYCPQRGKLIWRISNSSRARVGNIAGYIDTDGYRRVSVDGRKCQATNVIWLWVTGEWPDETIDHKDGNQSDDRWDNLRHADRSQQQWNTGVPRNNLSGCKGIYWEARRKKWYAQITAKGTRKHLGYFDLKEDAITARRSAEHLYYGQFSRASQPE